MYGLEYESQVVTAFYLRYWVWKWSVTLFFETAKIDDPDSVRVGSIKFIESIQIFLNYQKRFPSDLLDICPNK